MSSLGFRVLRVPTYTTHLENFWQPIATGQPRIVKCLTSSFWFHSMMHIPQLPEIWQKQRDYCGPEKAQEDIAVALHNTQSSPDIAWALNIVATRLIVVRRHLCWFPKKPNRTFFGTIGKWFTSKPHGRIEAQCIDSLPLKQQKIPQARSSNRVSVKSATTTNPTRLHTTHRRRRPRGTRWRRCTHLIPRWNPDDTLMSLRFRTLKSSWSPSQLVALPFHFASPFHFHIQGFMASADSSTRTFTPASLVPLRFPQPSP